ncbi:MAG: hypothetical protein CL823_05675 [Crocinitomicaceae bacterium]|nr:hypothetical protein [Crocinitomicaceae bacterium]|tara:strand:+ start:1619 stop:2140 length:522 start_codon:yes stop_codon:yes gene_type:complete
MLKAPILLSQDCIIIISEHVTTEDSNDKLIEHIDWLKQNLSNYSTDILFHACTGNSELSRVGDYKIRKLIESDSLLMYNQKSINYYKEFQLITDEIIHSFNHCLSQSKFQVIYSIPSSSTKINLGSQLDFIRKIAVVFDWTEPNGAIKDDISIKIINGYKEDVTLLKTIRDVK